MSRKGKGSNAERELIHLFHKEMGWSAIRVAGSGSSKYPSPDIIAGNIEKNRHIAIECKATRKDKQYLEKEEVEQLRIFATTFGAEAWIAVRFLSQPWTFLTIDQLEDTGKHLAISKKDADQKGIQLTNLIGLTRKI
jgi:holliday junction resolvase Hjr